MSNKIINLTQHKPTKSQIEAGVISDDPSHVIKALLSFHWLPAISEVNERAELLAEEAVAMAVKYDTTKVMIGGAPYLMEPLVWHLKSHNLQPVFAFSERDSIESFDESGNVVKRTVFKHIGFVEA